MLVNAKRRRLVGKQRAPAQWVPPPAALAALADEAWSEVTIDGAVAVVADNPPEKVLPPPSVSTTTIGWGAAWRRGMSHLHIVPEYYTAELYLSSVWRYVWGLHK